MHSGWALALFLATIPALLLGFPVAFTLAGLAIWFAVIGYLCGAFDMTFLALLPNRLFGLLTNQTLIAVPLFVLMGVVLEKARLAEELLQAMAQAFGRWRGGMAVAVLVVGTMLAASTGIVGATVVTLGLLALPSMLKRGYSPAFASGTLCATGTLGQLIPPSIALVLLGDALGNAYQQAQLSLGVYSLKAISVRDLFAGAPLPGAGLVLLYALFFLLMSRLRPELLGGHAPTAVDASEQVPADVSTRRHPLVALWPPLLLVLLVLGSILSGAATPTEAAAVGALGAMLIAGLRGRLTGETIKAAGLSAIRISGMVFSILIGATIYALVFRGFGGEMWVHRALSALPGGMWGALVVVMLLLFLLGFILDFIEIIFVVVPMVAPTLLALGADPVWLGILIAINLQTSFLTPPFGFALFYLRGVAPPQVTTSAIYRGVVPFIALQLLLLVAVAVWPGLVTALPEWLSGQH